MKYTIQKHLGLSGHQASIYVILNESEQETSLTKFVRENTSNFPDEVKDLLKRLRAIGRATGARKQYFKLEEGKPGDGVCALYDNPDKNLRLYCILNSLDNVIIGGGGQKPKGMKSFQESDKLTEENYFLRAVSQLFSERLKNKDIYYTNRGMDLGGDLTFEDIDLRH